MGEDAAWRVQVPQPARVVALFSLFAGYVQTAGRNEVCLGGSVPAMDVSQYGVYWGKNTMYQHHHPLPHTNYAKQFAKQDL